jgi:hypothetical protein
MQAFDSVNGEEFAAMSRKARLEAFSWAYCRTVAEASEEQLRAEAAELGLPVERLHTLAGLVTAERALILAKVLSIFGDREPDPDRPSELDTLLDEIMGTSGYQGTIPG